MAMEKCFQKDQSLKKHLLMGGITWLLGWSLFAVVEIMFRSIDGPPLLPFVSVMILIAYSGLGIAAGVTVSGLSTFLLKIMGRWTGSQNFLIIKPSILYLQLIRMPVITLFISQIQCTPPAREWYHAMMMEMVYLMKMDLMIWMAMAILS